MIVYSMLAITVLFAFVSLLVLWKSSSCSSLMVAVSLAAFIYLYGTWVFISIYGKYVFGACFLLALAISLLKKKSNPRYKLSKAKVIISSVLAAVLLLLSLLYYTGTTGKPYGTVNLALPFKTGTYFVFQGGRGLPTNIFHYSGRHTAYAMDIIKLNKTGNRAKHIFSKRLEDYEIFADTIYSPCNGVITKTESNNPDNIPPSMKRGPANLNHVLIETNTAYIFLGHMKQGCVFVQKGDTVVTGQPLGLAGNSGASLEPHLHIQAHAKTNTSIPWYKEPQLLIQFNGKEYLLFEEIHAPL